MAIPDKYHNQGERSITTYDFVDISSNTGFVTYYGGKTAQLQNDVTRAISGNYILSNQKFYSDVAVIAISGTPADPVTASMAVIMDLDFDIRFNANAIMRGNAIVTVPWGISGIVANFAGHPSATLKKVIGATESVIATVSGAVKTTSSGVIRSLDTMTLVVPFTQFKEGDVLRLTIEGYASMDTPGADSTIFFIGADPFGRITSDRNLPSETFASGDITTLTLLAPFKIEL